MTSARLFVRAIVVTDGRSDYLDEVLSDVASQDFAADSVHLVVVGTPPVVRGGLVSQVTTVPRGTTYGEAVDAVLAEHPAHDVEYLWLLHDDSAPLDGSLAALAATARKRTRAAVIGGAQVQWRDPSRLISLGSSVSPVGVRRVDLIDDLDINQGQYDWRDDVLSVSLAGALVRRDVWVELGGLDPAYRGFGDSADFCRLVWSAGYDVVVVPGALIRHVQLNLRGARVAPRQGSRTSYLVRRTGEWYYSLVWARLGAVPLLIVWAFLSSVVRAVLRVAQNEPRMTGADLAVPWRLLGRLGSLPRSRARVRRHRTVPASAVRRLLVGPSATLIFIRTRYLRAYDRWRAHVTPSGVVRAELAAAGARRRWTLAAVILLSLGASIVLFGAWLPELAAGKMLAGSVLGVSDISWHELWQRTWTGWSDTGFGAPALDGTFSALMLPLAILPGGLRLWLGLTLTFGVAAASMGAWFAAGAATRSVFVRLLAALAYGLWPAFLVSIASGRVGPVMAHLALPWVALGLARAVGWHRGEALGGGEEYTARRVPSPSAAAGAAVALVAVVAASPVLLVPTVALLVVVALFAGRRWLRVLFIAVPALLVSGPALVAATGSGSFEAAWAILSRDNGPAAPSPVWPWWRVALGADGTAPAGAWYSSDLVAGGLGVAVAVAALIALLSRRATLAVRFGWLAAAAGLATAIASQRVIAVHADGAGTADANGWIGPGMSLALVGVLTASASASSGVWRAGAGAKRAWRRTISAVALVGCLAIVVLQAAAWAWPGRPASGDVAAVSADALPLVAGLEQAPPNRARVLTLAEFDGGVVYSVESADGAHVLDGRAPFGPTGAPVATAGDEVPASPAGLASAVATLVAAGDGADDELANWGIGVIVVLAGSPHAEAGLSQVPTVALIGASEHGTSYRVIRGAVDVSRAWLESAGVVTPIPMEGVEGRLAMPSASGGALVVAAPADPSWQAFLDGTPLERLDDSQGRAAFVVPAQSGTLVIDYHDVTYRRWWWVGAVATAWFALASLPLHDRRILGARS